MRRPSYRQYHYLRPRVLPMSDFDRLINDELRDRAADRRDWRTLRQELEQRAHRHRRQRLAIGLGTLLLVAGVLIGIATL